MKKMFVGVTVLLVVASCSKQKDLPAIQKPQSAHGKEPQTCTFGLTQFNLIKRPPVDANTDRRPKNTTPPPPPSGAVILLDFDGAFVSGTSWNYNGDINC